MTPYIQILAIMIYFFVFLCSFPELSFINISFFIVMDILQCVIYSVCVSFGIKVDLQYDGAEFVKKKDCSVMVVPGQCKMDACCRLGSQ